MINRSAVVVVMLMFLARISCDCTRDGYNKVICKSIPVFTYTYIKDTWKYGDIILYLEIDNDGASLDLRSSTFVNLPYLRSIVIKSSNLTNIYGGSFKNLPLYQLSLWHDNVESIKKDSFADMPVSVLDLSFNKISEIEDGAFKNLNILKQLFLNYNKLTSVHPHQFVSNPEVLRLLSLENNRFKSITANMFKRLKNLLVLDLSFNQIETIEETAFRHTPNLIGLNLRYNNLKEIDEKVFPITGMTSLRQLLLDHNRLMYVSWNLLFRLGSLQYISVLGNPWFCKCFKLFEIFLKENSIEQMCQTDLFSENRPLCVVDRVDYCRQVYNNESSNEYFTNERNLGVENCEITFQIYP